MTIEIAVKGSEEDDHHFSRMCTRRNGNGGG
jgi:hypothetical protein